MNGEGEEKDTKKMNDIQCRRHYKEAAHDDRRG